MNELPDSRKEKNEYSDEQMKEARFRFPRWLYVHELNSLLDELKPDDWVTPNQVGNLLVERDIDGKSKSIGSIDFHFNELEYFDGEDEG